MVWVVFALIVYLVLFILVPFKRIKELWFNGILSLILLFLIDSTLVKAGAYLYKADGPMLYGLPLFYFLSGFAAGIYFIHYQPIRMKMRLPYILLMALIFLVIEVIMIKIGYFQHLNWTVLNSFFLNTFGFIVISWLNIWMNEIRKELNC